MNISDSSGNENIPSSAKGHTENGSYKWPYDVIKSLFNEFIERRLSKDNVLSKFADRLFKVFKEKHIDWCEQRLREVNQERRNLHGIYDDSFDEEEQTFEGKYTDSELRFYDAFITPSIFELRNDPLVLVFPRIFEMDGQSSIFLAEAMGAFPRNDNSISFVSWGLRDLLRAGRLYEALGRSDLAGNVWMRAHIACNNMIKFEIGRASCRERV